MTVEELMTTYNILRAKTLELYTQRQDAYNKFQEKHEEIMADPKARLEEEEPFRAKYISLFDEEVKAGEAFEAFKELEWGCVRKEGK